jgi:hypothetical protein
VSAKDDDPAGQLLIQEVDEELRREQYLALWRRYGVYIIILVVGVVVLVAGYEGWRAWQDRLRQEEPARFGAAAALVAEGKKDEGLNELSSLAADGRTGYATAALMAEADLKARSGDIKGAMDTYDRLASSGASAIYRDLAVLKGALLGMDSGDSRFESRLNGLTVAGNPWRYSALETLAAAALRKGDNKHAGDLFRQLADDLTAPQGVRARAAEMLAASAGLGGTPASSTPPASLPDKTKG